MVKARLRDTIQLDWTGPLNCQLMLPCLLYFVLLCLSCSSQDEATKNHEVPGIQGCSRNTEFSAWEPFLAWIVLVFLCRWDNGQSGDSSTLLTRHRRSMTRFIAARCSVRGFWSKWKPFIQRCQRMNLLMFIAGLSHCYQNSGQYMKTAHRRFSLENIRSSKAVSSSWTSCLSPSVRSYRCSPTRPSIAVRCRKYMAGHMKVHEKKGSTYCNMKDTCLSVLRYTWPDCRVDTLVVSCCPHSVHGL